MWGTLIKGNPDYRPELAKQLRVFLALKYNVSLYSNLIHIASVIKEAESYINYVSSSTGRAISLDEQVFHLLSRLGVYHKLITMDHIKDIHKIFDIVFIRHMPTIINLEDVRNVLEYCLYRKITTSILSNTSFITGAQLRVVLKRYDLLRFFTFMDFSDETGRCKPHPDAFRKLEDLLLLQGYNILHVGNSEKHDMPCFRYGIDPLLIYGTTRNTIKTVIDRIV